MGPGIPGQRARPVTGWLHRGCGLAGGGGAATEDLGLGRDPAQVDDTELSGHLAEAWKIISSKKRK